MDKTYKRSVQQQKNQTSKSNLAAILKIATSFSLFLRFAVVTVIGIVQVVLHTIVSIYMLHVSCVYVLNQLFTNNRENFTICIQE